MSWPVRYLTLSSGLVFVVVLLSAVVADAQGTFAFENLDFEAANLSGYQQGGFIPVTAAFPGWSAYIGSVQVQQVSYDFGSIGSTLISVIDSFGVQTPPPLQGSYSALLVGGLSGGSPTSASISQTGLVPANAKSIVADMAWGGPVGTAPVVTIDGQTITMFPELTFPRYTIYAGNIASFGGKTATLSFTAPGIASEGILELDNIIFSTAAIPEPRALGLFLIGALCIGGVFRQRNRK
jgi:hypothetical protein